MSGFTTPVTYFPNKMARMILEATEEILGRQDMHSILHLAELPNLVDNYPPNNLDLQFPCEALAKIQTALESFYGPRAGRGLALRTGRAWFKYGLREFGPRLGVTDPGFRMLPVNGKLRTGLKLIVDLYNQVPDQQVRLEEKEGQIYLQIEGCPICWGRYTENPTCDQVVGVLQEGLSWISGGKHFHVEEIECIARGDANCTIVIDKLPIE